MEITTTTNRVTFAGDWFGETLGALSALTVALRRKSDVILHTGSIGLSPKPKAVAYIDTVSDVLSSYNQTLYFIDGNREDFDYLYSFPLNEQNLRPIRPNIIHLPRGTRFTIDGVRFLAFGGGYTLNRRNLRPHKGYWPQETATAEEVQAALSIPDPTTDILLIHDSPHPLTHPRSKTVYRTLQLPKNLTKRYFDEEQAHRELLSPLLLEVKPRILIHGHYQMFDKYIYTHPKKEGTRQEHTYVVSLNEGYFHQTEHLLTSNLEVLKYELNIQPKDTND